MRTGTDHYSLAFTYDCIAWSWESISSFEVRDIEYDEEEHMGNSILVVDLLQP